MPSRPPAILHDEDDLPGLPRWSRRRGFAAIVGAAFGLWLVVAAAVRALAFG